MYSIYFVFLYNDATNSMQFANQVLLAANSEGAIFDPDPRILRFVAVTALSFFCLLHYFSGNIGRSLNQILAYIKIGLLIIVFFSGMARIRHNYVADWHLSSNPDHSSSATAFLLILFSFSGWENATFVSALKFDSKSKAKDRRSREKLPITEF